MIFYALHLQKTGTSAKVIFGQRSIFPLPSHGKVVTDPTDPSWGAQPIQQVLAGGYYTATVPYRHSQSS